MNMSNTEKTVKDIRLKPRRKFSTAEKIRIVMVRRGCTVAHQLTCLDTLLYRRFDSHIAHIGSTHGFSNCLGIMGIVLVALDVGL